MLPNIAVKARMAIGDGFWAGHCLSGVRKGTLRNGSVSCNGCKSRSLQDPRLQYHLGESLQVEAHEGDGPGGVYLVWLLTGQTGTCTDVHEGIETRLAARRMRQQLLSVITHAHITIFTVDLDGKITMLEGALIWDSNSSGPESPGSKWYMGVSVEEVFTRMHPELDPSECPDFSSATEAIFSQRSTNVVIEHAIDGRFYSTRLLPMTGRRGGLGESEIEGAIGVSSLFKPGFPSIDNLYT